MPQPAQAPCIIYELGSLRLTGGTSVASDGGHEYPAMKISLGGKHTTLDSYEALALKCRIEAWLEGELQERHD